jgi:hypothetical protein
MTCPMLEK